MNSRIFYTDVFKAIEKNILSTLEASDDFLTLNTLRSTRAAGDAIEDILTNSFEAILGDWCAEYSANFARRAMADLAFTDVDGFYYVVDVKTHRTDTKFNMPNLTSVERLSRFYEDDKNYFVLLMVSYHLVGSKANFTEVKFVPIEFLGWDCLTIGALGWGQIQIANSNYVTVNAGYSRKIWMLEFCDVILEFYPKEIAKIQGRMERFEKVRQFWLSKPE